MPLKSPTHFILVSNNSSQVGEEYILLLPECLPYLSEAMEDSASEVAALASEVIQSIEDVSGESLDSYLR
jgi:U3 small nucleolar RNA-associated protein 10